MLGILELQQGWGRAEEGVLEELLVAVLVQLLSELGMGLALAPLFVEPKHTVQLLGPAVESRMVTVAAIELVLVVAVVAALLLLPL